MAELDPFLWFLKVGGSQQEPVARLSDPPEGRGDGGGSCSQAPWSPEGHRDGDGEQDVQPPLPLGCASMCLLIGC